jgi:hypothetical protein
LPQLPDIPYDQFDTDNESDDSSDLGGAEGQPPISLKQMQSSLKQFAKMMGQPTLVHSTSERKYEWLGFSRRSIGPLSRDRTVHNRSEMDQCTGRRGLQIFQRISRHGCLWTISIMPKGFGSNVLKCFQRTMQARFRRQRRREGEATSDRRVTWESTRAP